MCPMIELSPRLAMVADLIPCGAKLADVGTDHAYLPAALMERGYLSGAIAADLRSGPLDRARQTVVEQGLADKIELRLCDGLSGIRPEEADTVVIAGMGGETIAAILAAAPWTRERNTRLILQPMSSMDDLRCWLEENGYAIEREELVREGETLYTAWSVRAGRMEPQTPAQLVAGRNQNHPLRGAWLDLWIGKVQRALDGLERSSREQSAARRQELSEVYEELVQMKKEWEQWQ